MPLHPTNLRNLRIIERLNQLLHRFLSILPLVANFRRESIEKSRPRPNGKRGRLTSIICSRMHMERGKQAERRIVEPVLFLKFARFTVPRLLSTFDSIGSSPIFQNFWIFICSSKRIRSNELRVYVIYENRIGCSGDSGSSFTQRQSFSATRCLQSVSTSGATMQWLESAAIARVSGRILKFRSVERASQLSGENLRRGRVL